MSLYGVLRSGVSGMNAQGSRLATTADNIANANTVGYKRASTEFASMVIGNSRSGAYQPAGVTTQTRYAIGEAGSYLSTTSGSDLAITGSGFFVVNDAGGTPYLTRAGSFVQQPDGTLKNTGGYTLLGYDITNGPASPTANSLAGLVPINVKAMGMTTTPTTTGSFAANLNSNAAVGDTLTSSMTVYDYLGNESKVNVSFTKTANNTWTYNAVNPPGAAATGTLTFDNTTGQLTATPVTATVAIPDATGAVTGQTMTLDLSGMTQLASADFVPKAEANGNPPQSVDSVEIADDGIVYAIFGDGTRKATFQIALADVPSPDNLRPVSGNAYALSQDSGNPIVGFAGTSGFGVIGSGSLEQSNADMASELTAMIEAQRGYTANSKVFQTGSDLLDVLVNLKR